MEHTTLNIHHLALYMLFLLPFPTIAQLQPCESYGSAELTMAELYVDLADVALDLVNNCDKDYEACDLAHEFLYRADDILSFIFEGRSTGGCIDCDLTEFIELTKDIQGLAGQLRSAGRSNRLGNQLQTFLDWKDLTCKTPTANRSRTKISPAHPFSTNDHRGDEEAHNYPCTSDDMTGKHNSSFWGTGGAIPLYKHGDVFCNKKKGWFMVLDHDEVVKYEINRSSGRYEPVEFLVIKDVKYLNNGKTRYVTEGNYWLTVY